MLPRSAERWGVPDQGGPRLAAFSDWQFQLQNRTFTRDQGKQGVVQYSALGRLRKFLYHLSSRG